MSSTSLRYNFKYLFFDKLLQFINQFILITVIAKYLGPVNYGRLSFALAIISIFSLFSNWGLEKTLILRLPNSLSINNSLLSAVLLKVTSSLIIIFLIYFSLNYFRIYFKLDISVANLIFLLLPIIFFNLWIVFDSYFQSRFKSYFSSIARICSFFAIISIRLICVFFKVEFNTIALIHILEQFLITLFLILFLCYKINSFKRNDFQISVTLKEFKYYLISGINFTFINALIIIQGKIILFFIINKFNNGIAGTFSLITSIFDIIISITSVFTVLFLPKLVHYFNISFDDFYNYFKNILFPILLITSFIISFFLLITGVFIDHYFNNYPMFKLFYYASILTIPFVFISYSFNLYLIALNKSYQILYVTFSSILITILLSYIIIPLYNEIGILYSYIISQFIICIILPFLFIKSSIKLFINSINIILTRTFYINIIRLYRSN